MIAQIKQELTANTSAHAQTDEQCIYLQNSNETLQADLEKSNEDLAVCQKAKKELEEDFMRFKTVRLHDKCYN